MSHPVLVLIATFKVRRCAIIYYLAHKTMVVVLSVMVMWFRHTLETIPFSFQRPGRCGVREGWMRLDNVARAEIVLKFETLTPRLAMILSLLVNKHQTACHVAADDTSKRRLETLCSNQKDVSIWRRCRRAVNLLPSACFSFLVMGSSSLPGHCYPAMGTSLLATTATTDQPDLTLPASRSWEAARLLLDPPSSKVLSKQAWNELEKQRALQDFRLAICQETGSNFDQCFFYGTKNTKIGAEFGPSLTPSNSREQQEKELQSVPIPNPIPQSERSKIPTW
jgi:hypothetical protein